MQHGNRTVFALMLALALVLAGCANSAQQTSDSAQSATSDYATEVNSSADTTSSADDVTTDTAQKTKTELTLWTDDSQTAKLVKEYVANVTDESSPDFIPVEDRVVVTDFDGTLFGELDPIYYEWAMYIHRVLWDSTYTPTAEQVEVAHAIEEVEQTRKFPETLEAQHAKCLAEAFKGMSLEDYNAYVAEYGETDAPKFKNLKRKDAYFKPMVELVNYLHDNDFDIYVVSGTERNALRVLLSEYFPWMDPSHMKGSVATIEAAGQEGKDGLEYTWTADDELTLGGKLIIKDVKANKPTIIATEIGKQPVISLGNSSGDSSMANYVVNNNKYQSLALMLCCDDTDRDWGELDKAEKMVKSCEENGWHAVSQKNEWKTIFGDEVEIDKDWVWSSEKVGPNQAQTENVAGEAAGETEQELALAA